MGPYGSLLVFSVLISSCESLGLLMGPYVFLLVLINPDGSLLVHISPCKFLCCFRGPYGSLLVLLCPNGCL